MISRRHVHAALLSTRLSRGGPKALQFEDSEFGTVICQRSATSRFVRLRVTSDGKLRATLPPGGALKHVKSLLDDSRDELRKLIGTHQLKQPRYTDGQRVGQSHRLQIIRFAKGTITHTIRNQQISVALPVTADSEAPAAQKAIRTAVKAALKVEAKAYLPRRLAHLAERYGLSYEKIRFANQSGRWGSCSSSGTISLNIALMNLPMELIDYVLTHELCHTVHMHHQPMFWELVARYAPNYRELRKELKQHSPHI